MQSTAMLCKQVSAEEINNTQYGDLIKTNRTTISK